MKPLPSDIGSNEVIAALRRLGFVRGPKKSGSHQSYKKQRQNGSYIVVTVVEGKKVIPKGTLDAIIERAEITRDEFLAEL